MARGQLATTARVDAFTDAVLAIILTLMAVELAPPAADSVHRLGLWGALLDQWPEFLAFAISFLLVGQVWMSHHAMWRWIERVDRPTLALQLAHLFFVSLIPLASRVLAEHLTEPPPISRSGAAFYAGVALMNAVFFNLVWLWVRVRRLVVPDLSHETARLITLRWGSGVPLYAAALGLAFVDVRLSLAAYLALILYFVLPGPGEQRAPSGD